MKTTIRGKEIELFGNAEISKIYTSVVQGYLSLGFILSYGPYSSGTQGENMKVDLSNDNGKTVYRIWLVSDRESLLSDESWVRIDILSIVVKKYDGQLNTLWFSRGELVSEEKFYSITDGHSRHTCYCRSKEDSVMFEEMRKERWHNRYVEGRRIVELPAKYYKLVYKVTKKITGYKSLPLSSITGVSRDERNYYVSFSNDKKCHFARTR